jgi:hypothetical protein
MGPTRSATRQEIEEKITHPNLTSIDQKEIDLINKSGRKFKFQLRYHTSQSPFKTGKAESYVKKSKKILEELNFKDLKLSQSEIQTCLKLCQFVLNSQPCYVGRFKEDTSQPVILLNPYQLAGRPLSETIDLYGEEIDVDKILQFQDEVALGFKRFRTNMYQVRHNTILGFQRWRSQEGSVPHPGQLCGVKNLTDQEKVIGSEKRLRLCLIKELVPGKDGKPPTNALVQLKDRRKSDFSLETKEVSLRNLAPLLDKNQLSLDLRQFQVKKKDLQTLQYESFPEGHCQLEQENKKHQREKIHVPVKVTSIPQEDFDQLNKRLGGSKRRTSMDLEQYEPKILPERLITGRIETRTPKLRSTNSQEPLKKTNNKPEERTISERMEIPHIEELKGARRSISGSHHLNQDVQIETKKDQGKSTRDSQIHTSSDVPTTPVLRRSKRISGRSKVKYPI